jgi:alpha-tubulin suppressor-like RCC1 family protein
LWKRNKELKKMSESFGDAVFVGRTLDDAHHHRKSMAAKMTFGVDSTVYVWGNIGSRIGLGDMKDVNISGHKPRVHSELTEMRVVDVACGSDYTLILLAHGDVYVCDSNTKLLRPTLVQELFKKKIVQVACAGLSGCLALR